MTEIKEPNVSFKDEALNKKEIIHQVKGEKKLNRQKLAILLITFLIVGAGVLTGYFLSQAKGKIMFLNKGSQPKVIKSAKIIGSTDQKSFRDSAEGKLERGGIDGEGTHKLIRPGGSSQTVYLTSSVIDLEQYVGKKVKVWGETFAAQKAGWLMDVGRIEIY